MTDKTKLPHHDGDEHMGAVEGDRATDPNQFHGITIPSYKKDRLERYVAWYDKYLKPRGTTTESAR